MEYRNPKHVGDGRIDCEINHPEYGWIPFTADPNDGEEFGRTLHATMVAAGGIAPADAAPPVLSGISLNKRQWDWMLRRYELDTKVSDVLEYLRANDREEYASLMDILDFSGRFYLSEAVAIISRLSSVLVATGNAVPTTQELEAAFTAASQWTGASPEAQET